MQVQRNFPFLSLQFFCDFKATLKLKVHFKKSLMHAHSSRMEKIDEKKSVSFMIEQQKWLNHYRQETE